jgi:uncharacterized protein (DUF736 family)
MEDNIIGACWLRESKRGSKYMSGNIEIDGKRINFVIFKNKNKKNDKQPDYNILESKRNS